MVADKTSFRNALVSMRPHAAIADLPSAYNVTTYLHNEFVKRLEDLKAQITVSVFFKYHKLSI